MVKLRFALGLVKRSQNLLNKESFLFLLRPVDIHGWLESDDRILFWRFSSPSSLLSEIKTTVFFIAVFSALRRHSNN